MKNRMIRKNKWSFLSITFLAFALLGGLFLAEETQARTPGQRAARVNHRQASENRRIHQGVKQGDFSRREARDLRSDRRKIRRIERRALKNDGRIGPKEAARLENKQDQLNGKIYQYRHNEEARGTGPATPVSGATLPSDAASAPSVETTPSQ